MVERELRGVFPSPFDVSIIHHVVEFVKLRVCEVRGGRLVTFEERSACLVSTLAP